MSQYILDTDHVTLSQHGNSKILQRAQSVGSSNIFITTVTLEEQLKGRLASISKCATKPELLVVAYRNLRITQIYFCSMNLLDFDDAAYSYYQSLRQQKIQVGTQDLRIAAISLSPRKQFLLRVITKTLAKFLIYLFRIGLWTGILKRWTSHTQR